MIDLRLAIRGSAGIGVGGNSRYSRPRSLSRSYDAAGKVEVIDECEIGDPDGKMGDNRSAYDES